MWEELRVVKFAVDLRRSSLALTYPIQSPISTPPTLALSTWSLALSLALIWTIGSNQTENIYLFDIINASTTSTVVGISPKLSDVGSVRQYHNTPHLAQEQKKNRLNKVIITLFNLINEAPTKDENLSSIFKNIEKELHYLVGFVPTNNFAHLFNMIKKHNIISSPYVTRSEVTQVLLNLVPYISDIEGVEGFSKIFVGMKKASLLSPSLCLSRLQSRKSNLVKLFANLTKFEQIIKASEGFNIRDISRASPVLLALPAPKELLLLPSPILIEKGIEEQVKLPEVICLPPPTPEVIYLDGPMNKNNTSKNEEQLKVESAQQKEQSEGSTFQFKESLNRGHGWNYYSMLINEVPLTNEIIEIFINKFWLVAYPSGKQPQNLFLACQFKIQLSSGEYRSITPIQTGLEVGDKENLIATIVAYWELKSDHYKDFKISSIEIMWKLLSPKIPRHLSMPKSMKAVETTTYKDLNIPNSLDLSKWGVVSQITANTYQIKRFKSATIYNVTEHVNLITKKLIYRNVEAVDPLGTGKVLFSFIDSPAPQYGSDTFTRLIDKKTFIISGEKVVFMHVNKTCKFISSLSPSKSFNPKFITMDIETRVVNGKFEPICISLFDGENIKSYFIHDFTTSDKMLIAALKFTFNEKYKGYNLYLHNLAYFDGVFLLRHIARLSQTVKPIIRDGRIISLEVKYGNNCIIKIFDSLNLLPVALDKLAKTFKVENKGLFPYDFVNDRDLNYVGQVPILEHFITKKHLNDEKAMKVLKDAYASYVEDFKNKPWNLKEELIKYCEQDVKILHQILMIFGGEIFNKFKIDISKYPTLPSLSFAIFRTSFMKCSRIPILAGNIYKDITNAYRGGYVDVYRPQAEKVKSYDINSLYPSAMFNHKMPVGAPTYFEGDAAKFIPENDLFGFFFVEVEAPQGMQVPILQHTITVNNTKRTLCPIGSWTGWYFSEELKNAQKAGYKIKILKGYIFEKENIFKDYVEHFYHIKQNSPKDSPWFAISKMLLNSLYGRFGMNPYLLHHAIIKESELQNLLSKCVEVISTLELGEDLILTSIYKPTNDDSLDSQTDLNISIATAASISAYSRVIMTHYLNKYKDNIVYIDTDGIKVNCEIDPSEVGPELGQMKDEGTFSEGVFLAPKVYGLLSGDGSTVVKAKGVNVPIAYSQLKSLLSANNKSLSISQEKWFRDFEAGTINVKETIYTLMVTANKREVIFNEEGKFVNTKPYNVKGGSICKE